MSSDDIIQLVATHWLFDDPRTTKNVDIIHRIHYAIQEYVTGISQKLER
jgi:uncharacterized membrane protein YukC